MPLALVEFAIVFPIFMLVLSGILDFGFMLYSRMTVINAAREGVRVVVGDVSSGDAVTIKAIPSKVTAQVNGSASGLTLADLSTTTTCVQPNGSACYYDANVGTPVAVSQNWAKVTVTYTYHSFFPLLFGTTFNLSSSVQMVLE